MYVRQVHNRPGEAAAETASLFWLLNCDSWLFASGLVPKLGGYVALFVHFAKRALMDYLWRARAQPQNSVRHHPRLNQDIRVLNGHLVKNLIALPRQLLDHMHVGGMEQAAASEPGCIDEVGG